MLAQLTFLVMRTVLNSSELCSSYCCLIKHTIMCFNNKKYDKLSQSLWIKYLRIQTPNHTKPLCLIR